MGEINIEKELNFIKENNQIYFDELESQFASFKNQGTYDLFVTCYKKYMERNSSTMRWELAFEHLFHSFCNSEFYDLLQNVSKSNLSDVDYITLSSILMEERNIYDLSDLSDFENSTSIKYNQLKDVIGMIRRGATLEHIKSTSLCVDQVVANKEELIKDLIFRKTYNLSYSNAIAIMQSFGKDLKNIKGIDQQLVDMISNISMISQISDIDDLIAVFERVKLSSVNMSDSFSLERNLASSFQNVYGSNFYHTKEADFKGYLQNGIPILEITQAFNMCVSSLGGVFQNDTREYLDDWQKRNSSFISTSLISNRNMNTCPITNVCYGFDSFGVTDILDAGTSNLHVNDGGYGNPQSNYRKGKVNHVKYCMPQKLMQDTLTEGKSEQGCWNEVAYRRFDSEGNKIIPSYIVYFSEGEINANDEIWKNSISAAEQFKIPIVVINKKKIEEYNKENANDETIIPIPIPIKNSELAEINSSISYTCRDLLNKTTIQHQVEDNYSERIELQHSLEFDDPVYAELFKRYHMESATEEEQYEFMEKYQRARTEVENGKVDNIESADRIGPRR